MSVGFANFAVKKKGYGQKQHQTSYPRDTCLKGDDQQGSCR